MIPKINKFLFYTSSDSGLVQQIGETQEVFLDASLSEKDQQIFKNRQQALFDLIMFDFQLEEYGRANWFIDNSYEDCEMNNLISFLRTFNQLNTIKTIHRLYDFYKENKNRFDYLKPYPDDANEKRQELEEEMISEKIHFNCLDESIKVVAQDIRKNPDKYCRDEKGQRISTHFTGFLDYKRKDGNIFKAYNFLQGKAHGLCLDFNVHTQNKEKLSFFNKGELIQTLKKWDYKGNLAYEKTYDIEKEWRDGNLFIVKDFRNDLMTCYYEKGRKKYEAKEITHYSPRIIKKWDEYGNVIEP